MNNSNSATRMSSATHKRVQQSTTLNRKYVKRPAAKVSAATTAKLPTAKTPVSATRTMKSTPSMSSSIKSSSPSARSAQIAEANRAAANLRAEAMARRAALAEQINRENLAKMRKAPMTSLAKTASPTPVKSPSVGTSMGAPLTKETTRTSMSAPSAKEISNREAAMNSAMRSVATMDTKKKKKFRPSRTFTVKRIALAFACSAIIVGGLFYFIKYTTPDLNLSVAAMQVGFDVNSRFFIPRDYTMTGVTTEAGKISMTFAKKDGSSYTITEELSAWDSATLEKNYVKDNFSNYSKVDTQGLILFISDSNCAWVNGGKFYTIKTTSGSLTSKQLKSIAVSL